MSMRTCQAAVEPSLSPSAKSVVATASEEQEKHNNNQNSGHSILQKQLLERALCI
jgi:hypothetical protein